MQKGRKKIGDFNKIMTCIEVDTRDEVELYDIASFFTPNCVYWVILLNTIIEEKYINYKEAEECYLIAKKNNLFDKEFEEHIINCTLEEIEK